MSVLGIIRAVLELIKELFGYGKKVEKKKLEEMVDARRRDKLDWVRGRMSDNDPPEAGRDEADNPEQ
tara:strand:+ start:110 stop:310 length:201 start_codon:yes stop_codon:yes gene_type:complete